MSLIRYLFIPRPNNKTVILLIFFFSKKILNLIYK